MDIFYRNDILEPWTAQRERAAELFCEGRLNPKEIAAEVGIDLRNLQRWRRCAEFRRPIEEHFQALRAAMRKHTLADKDNRIAFLMSRLAALRGIVRDLAVLREVHRAFVEPRKKC